MITIQSMKKDRVALRKIKYLIITFLSVCIMSTIYSQKRFGTSDGIQKAEMNGEFAVEFSETKHKFFIAVDLNQLSTDQKGKFESLVFNDNRLVAVSTPSEENVWYLSSLKSFKKEDMLLLLIQFKEKAQTLPSTSKTKYE